MVRSASNLSPAKTFEIAKRVRERIQTAYAILLARPIGRQGIGPLACGVKRPNGLVRATRISGRSGTVGFAKRPGLRHHSPKVLGWAGHMGNVDLATDSVTELGTL